MKYLRVFNNNAEYQQFKDGDEYITPNVCLNIETNGIKCEAYIPPPPPPVVQPSNEIWYTSSDGNIVTPYIYSDFGANIVSNTYENGKGIIKFDGDVTQIGDGSFTECTLLTSVTIPDSVTEIGGETFYQCTSLTSVTISNSVTRIGERAFSRCTSLTSVTIPDSVTEIRNDAFAACASLTSVTIPDRVISIGNNVFASCESLTSVTIGNSVIEIGGAAFYGCTSLTSVTIPDSVTDIGDAVFYDCVLLKEIYCKSTIPARMYYAFGNNAPDFKIYVPTASVDTYKTAEVWSDYADYIVGYDFEDEGGSELIIFYINDDVDIYTMTAAKGMSWDEFINSNYAAQNDVIYDFKPFYMGSYYVVYCYHEYAGCDGQLHYNLNVGDYRSVKTTDIIEDGVTYIWH